MSRSTFHYFAHIEDFPEDGEYLIKNAEGEPVEAEFSTIISSEHKDQQNDIVDQQGMDMSAFMRKGMFNYEHSATKIGYPVSYERCTLDGLPATRVKGRLYLTTKRGRETHELMRAMSKSAGARRMGCSVEGPIFARDPKDKSRITKSRVEHVAITLDPANTKAQIEMVKHMCKAAGLKEKDDDTFEEPEEDNELESMVEDEAEDTEKDDASMPDLPGIADKGGDKPGADKPGGMGEPGAAPAMPDLPDMPALPDAPAADLGMPLPSPEPMVSAADITLLLMRKIPDLDIRQAEDLARAIINLTAPATM